MTTICFLCKETPGPSPSVEFVSHDLGYAHPYCLAGAYRDLLTRLDAAERERDKARHWAAKWKHVAKAFRPLVDGFVQMKRRGDHLAKRAARLLERNTELTAANARLCMYVQHHGGCSWKYPDLRCTCGLTALLSLRAAGEEGTP